MSDTPPQDQETRAAIRLVAVLSVVALALYAAMGWVVTPNATLTRQGMSEEAIEALADLQTFDRASQADGRPILWLVGSSLVRESFDDRRIAERLPELAVQRYAFPRGAPLFVNGLIDELDLKAGDIVVTSVHPSHFQPGWLEEYAPDLYLNTLLDADELLALDELPLAERLEFAAGNLPPRSFWQFRDPYGQAIAGWWLHASLGEKRPRARPLRHFERIQRRRGFDKWAPLAEMNQIAPGELDFSAGNPNQAALDELRAAVRAADARLMVFFTPQNPLWYERSLDAETLAEFHRQMSAQGDYYRLPELPADHFMDYRHVNRRGRRVLTSALVDLLRAED